MNATGKLAAHSAFISLPEAHQKFRKYFPGQSFSSFIDGLHTVLAGKPKIDIIKFDDFLHDRYGQYESDGLSTEALLKVKHGPAAALFIKGLL
jgi:hypothetical protein